MRSIVLVGLSPLVFLACGKESPIAPSANIISPEDGNSYYSDQKILFEGLITDDAESASELMVLWESDIDGELDWANEPDSQGRVLGYGLLSEGQHAVSLTATDRDGLIGRDALLLNVGPANTAPSCEITAPPEGSTTNEGDTVNFVAQVDDVDIGPEDLSISWSSDVAGALGTSTADSDGLASLEVAGLETATHTISLTVSDEMGLECQAELTHKIGQAPRLTWEWPDADAILSTESPGIAHVNVDDDSHPVEDLEVLWASSLDGSLTPDPIDAFGNSMRDLGDLSLGTHVLTVTATNPDELTGTASRTLTINGMPDAPTVQIQPDPAYSPDDLVGVVSEGVDPEGDSQTFLYQWSKDGVLDSSLTGDTVPNPATSKGEVWMLRVRTNDGFGNSPWAQAEITVSNSLPVLSSVAISPSSPTANDPLVCTYAYADSDADPDGSVIQWSIDSAVVGSGPSLAASAIEKGDVVTCLVTANDGEEDGNSATDSVTVANSPPVVSGVAISPSSPTVSDALTCSYTYSDADNDPDASSVTWTVGSTVVGKGTTLAAGSAVKNESVVCSVQADDAEDTGNTATASTTIQNSIPTTPVVSISPSKPAVNDDLVCGIDTVSTDADNDSITYTFEWEVNAASWTGSTSTTVEADDTIASSNLTEGEEWTCIVTPDDGTDFGTASEDSVTVNEECGVALTDIDGNSYATVEIGDQCWMASNLNTTTDASGTAITRWCCNCGLYGGMYEWSTVMNGSTTEGTQGICPDGWHVPSDADWFELESYIDPNLSNSSYVGWSSTTIGDQLYLGGAYGFDWITGGFCYGGNGCNYDYDRIGYWVSSDYSSTEAVSRFFNTGVSGSNRDYRDKGYGFYVRCLRD